MNHNLRQALQTSSHLLIWFMALVFGTKCQADIIISIQDANIIAGDVGTADVLIRSTGTDNVFLVNYAFQIEQISSGPAGALVFETVQSSSEQSAVNRPYFLGSDTDSVNFSSNPSLDGLSLTGGDFAKSFNNVTLTTSDRLLARLDLQHIGVGQTGQFKISLIQNSTFVNDASLNDVAIASQSFSNFGTIFIQTTAVPEPTAILGLTSMSLAMFISRRRQAKSVGQAAV